MSELGQRIADEAFTWLNTPYVHQGNIKHRAVDCKNFIESVIRDTLAENVKGGTALLEVVRKYQALNGIRNDYKREENGEEMLRILNEHLVEVPKSTRLQGDVIALCDEICREPDIIRHLVIIHKITPVTTYVMNATEYGVRRHRLDGRWERRIHSIWRVNE